MIIFEKAFNFVFKSTLDCSNHIFYLLFSKKKICILINFNGKISYLVINIVFLNILAQRFKIDFIVNLNVACSKDTT